MGESYGCTQTTFNSDQLIAGDYPLLTKAVTIASGQNLTRGTLLGVITASGKSIKSLSAATDGSEVPDSILTEDADATSSDLERVAYIAGEFNETEVIFGTGHSAASVKATLRDKNMYLKPVVAS